MPLRVQRVAQSLRQEHFAKRSLSLWLETQGVVVASANNDAVSSGFDVSVLFNHGSVISAKQFGNAVSLSGDINFVSNAAGASIIAAGTAIFLNGDSSSVENRGSIQGLGDEGVHFGSSSDVNRLTNFGTIFGRSTGVENISNRAGGVIENHGVISSGSDAISLFTSDALVTTIINASGAIIRGGAGPFGHAIDVLLAGRISVDNAGTIVGDIAIDRDINQRDVVANHGKITGNLFLSGGNDLFKGTGGVSGAVHGEGG